MEPVTHFLTGACLARTGLNRKAAYATLAMTLAAEAPDLDVLWSAEGPVAAFQHHRGWTHTFLGVPLEAAVVVGLVWLLHRWRTGRGKTTAAPVRWAWLWGMCCLALMSHLLLDWTNNYGLRPFFPFNPRWYEGSFVFIVEPVMLVLLAGALVAPALFGLIGSEVGARRRVFRGRGWAVAGLLGVVMLWGWRAMEHDTAVHMVQGADAGGAAISRVTASPYPVTPFKWHVVAETPDFYQLANADTRAETLPGGTPDRIYKPPTTLATLAAKRSWLGEAYLDWSSWPVVTEQTAGEDGLVPVTFDDLRFMYDLPMMSGRRKPPLRGIAFVDSERRVVRMELNGQVQK